MPGQDGTGPMGEGPMAGKARGECIEKTQGNFGSDAAGFGWRGGRGQGRGAGGQCRGGGRRWGWGGIGEGACRRSDSGGKSMVEVDPDQEIATLEVQMEHLRQAQEVISRRIEGIKAARTE